MKASVAHPTTISSAPTTPIAIETLFFCGFITVQFPLTFILLLIIPQPEMAVI